MLYVKILSTMVVSASGRADRALVSYSNQEPSKTNVINPGNLKHGKYVIPDKCDPSMNPEKIKKIFEKLLFK